MSHQIDCPRCRGIVLVPENLVENVTCPFCRQFLMSVDRRTGAIWRQRPDRRRLLRLAGIAIVALLGIPLVYRFLMVFTEPPHASRRQREFMELAANPWFLAGLAAGVFLLWRSRNQPRPHA